MPAPTSARIVLQIACLGLLPGTMAPAHGQEVTRRGIRYEMTRATVYFEAGAATADQMAAFSQLVDKGIEDVDRLLNRAEPGVGNQTRINFVVRNSIPMSRSFRRTVMLPADRVRRATAPYLHETTHVLFPMKQECLWLSEGFASYVQSYVAEQIGGYDGYVFSWGGNRNIDRLARRALNSDSGRAVLAFVGAYAEPEGLFEKRLEVAQPLYILSHSLVKFMVEQAGLQKVIALAQSADIAGSAAAVTGRTIDGWKADWLVMLEAPRAERAPTR